MPLRFGVFRHAKHTYTFHAKRRRPGLAQLWPWRTTRQPPPALAQAFRSFVVDDVPLLEACALWGAPLPVDPS